MKEIVSAYLSEAQKIVAEGQEDGTILAVTSPETVAVMFLGIILPTAVIRNVSGGVAS